MKYRYLTFDCYGTLIDWKAGIVKELRAAVKGTHLSDQELFNTYVAAERNQESTYKRYREVLRDTALTMSGIFEAAVDPSAAEAFAASVPKWPAFGDTRSFLLEMGSRGYKRYILSNVDDDLLEETIKNNGLEVDGFVTAEQVGSYKPRPDHWLELMRRTGAPKEQILHLAQSVFHDIIPTQQLGISSAWTNRYNERFPKDASPLLVADSLFSLASVLE